MDSDLHRNHQQQQIMNSGLTRYRSAPSSYLSNLIGSGLSGDEDSDQFFNNRVPSPETERILSRFMASFAGGNGDNSSSHQNLGQIGGNEPQIINSVKKEQEGIYSEPQQQQQMIYVNQSQSQSQQVHNLAVSRSSMDQPLMAAANPPANLLRQSSSPAGFFAHLNMDNGYPLIRSMDDFGADSLPDSSFSSGKRLKGETSFSSGSPLSSGLLARIPENEGKIMAFNSTHNDGSLGETRQKDGDYVARYPSSSWDDSVMLSDSFLKDLGESDENMFSNLNSSENQNNEGRIRAPTMLTHHLSLPASTSESMEKLLQFQDYVPLKSSRAKRGCATHPRSIAERVRRTKISERMRKLQELVPNMDKQTNTADMLDLAVDYIKELQKQAKALSDSHAKCTCPHKQKI